MELPYSRGKRVSALVAFDYRGFFGWAYTEGTYTWQKFHNLFVERILPRLNPWPMARSIVVLDNAKIHMCLELERAIASRGAILIFLPPYSPQLNPIEVGFTFIKRWIQKNGNRIFNQTPEQVLDTAFLCCASDEYLAINLYTHCGYNEDGSLDIEPFRQG